MIHRVSDFSLFNSNILLLSHNNVTPEVPEDEEGGAQCFHMQVKVAVLNAISQNYNFFEV